MSDRQQWQVWEGEVRSACDRFEGSNDMNQMIGEIKFPKS